MTLRAAAVAYTLLGHIECDEGAEAQEYNNSTISKTIT